jgi:hypothetical protein
MRLCEEFKIVPVLMPIDLAGGAGTCESINMKNYRHCTLVLLSGAGTTGDSVLKVREGATDGATTADLTFSYRKTAIACKTEGGDVLGTEATSAALTLTAADYTNMALVVEIDPATMTDGYDWITPNISAVANPLLVSIVAILYPKYGEASLHSAIT